MVQNLAHLHDTYDSCLDQKLTILFDVLMRSFLFNLQFGLKRDIDVYAEFFAIKTLNVGLIRMRKDRTTEFTSELLGFSV